MQSGSQSRPKRMTTRRSSSDMMAWSTCQPVTRWGRTTEPIVVLFGFVELWKICYLMSDVGWLVGMAVLRSLTFRKESDSAANRQPYYLACHVHVWPRQNKIPARIFYG